MWDICQVSWRVCWGQRSVWEYLVSTHPSPPWTPRVPRCRDRNETLSPVISVEFLCEIRTQCGGVPVIGENTDCRWVVGAVRHIKRPYLGHEIQEEPSHFLLELRKPSITEHWGELLHKYRANILLRSFLNLGYKSIFPILTTHSAIY